MDVHRPKNIKKKSKVLILLSVALTLVLIVVFLSNSDLRSKSISKNQITLASVQKGELLVNAIGSGKLEPKNIEWISSRSDGVVSEVFVKSGDFVKESQPLFRIINEDLMSQYEEKRSRASEAKAILSAKQFEVHAKEIDYEIDFEEAKKNSDLIEALYRKQKSLFDAGIQVIPLIDFQQTEINLLQLKRLAEAKKNRWIDFKARKTSFVSQYMVNVTAAEAELKYISKKVNALTVASKTAGRVQDFDIKNGQLVKSGDAIAKVIGAGGVFSKVQVAAIYSSKLRPGQEAIIEFNKKKWPGFVQRIDPNVKGATVDVDLYFHDQPENALNDMYVSAEIIISKIPNAKYVTKPYGSIENGISKMYKIVKSGAKAELVEVQTGMLTSNKIQILDGIDVGDQIIVSKVDELVHDAQEFHIK